MSRFSSFLSAIARISAAVILIQILYLQLSASPLSVHIFSTLGMEPFGRWVVGIVQLISVLLLLFPRTSLYGASLALLVMGIACYFHLTVLGIEVLNDGGRLFALSILVGFCCLSSIYLQRREIPFLRMRRRKLKVFG